MTPLSNVPQGRCAFHHATPGKCVLSGSFVFVKQYYNHDAIVPFSAVVVAICVVEFMVLELSVA